METVINFEGYRLILMLPTREHVTSIHIDLVGQGITSEKAVSLINRFLTLMTWCDDSSAFSTRRITAAVCIENVRETF